MVYESGLSLLLVPAKVESGVVGLKFFGGGLGGFGVGGVPHETELIVQDRGMFVEGVRPWSSADFGLAR